MSKKYMLMKKLLSLPPNLVECFHDIMHADHKEWFCTSDPVGKKLGFGRWYGLAAECLPGGRG